MQEKRPLNHPSNSRFEINHKQLNHLIINMASNESLKIAAFEKSRLELLRFFSQENWINKPIFTNLNEFILQLDKLYNELFGSETHFQINNTKYPSRRILQKEERHPKTNLEIRQDQSSQKNAQKNKKKEHWPHSLSLNKLVIFSPSARSTSSNPNIQKVTEDSTGLNRLFGLMQKLFPLLLNPIQLSILEHENFSKPNLVFLMEKLLDILDYMDHQFTHHDSLECQKIALLLKKIHANYKESSFYDLGSKRESKILSNFPAVLTAPGLTPRHLNQNLALKLFGINENGSRIESKHYKNATHYVVEVNGVHFKLEDERAPLKLGKEYFIQHILREVFPRESDYFLTPSTLLHLEGVCPNNLVLRPAKFIQASLTVEGTSLTNWLIIKEITDLMRGYNGSDLLKDAIYHWITDDYLQKGNSQDLFRQVIDNQASMYPHMRILDFCMTENNGYISDRLEGLRRILLAEEGEEQLCQVFSFILKWPILASQFSLLEIVKWVPMLKYLPELFLRRSCEEVNNLIQTNPDELVQIVNHINEQLLNFWNLLDVPSALALAVGTQIINGTDGKGENYQVFFNFEKNKAGKECITKWYITLIDIEDQVLDYPIVNDLKNDTKHYARHRAGLKSILFFIDILQKATLSEFIQFNQSPEIVFLNSIAKAKAHNKMLTHFTNSLIYTEKTELNLGFPLSLNPKDLISIYENIRFLYQFIKHYPKGTLREYLYYYNAPLARFYEVISTKPQFINRPSRAYIEMTSKSIEDVINRDELCQEIMQPTNTEFEQNSFFRRTRKPSFPPRLMYSQVSPRDQLSTANNFSSSSLLSLAPNSKTLGQLLSSETYSSRLDSKDEIPLNQVFIRTLKHFPWKEIVHDSSLLNHCIDLIKEINAPEEVNLEEIIPDSDLCGKVQKDSASPIKNNLY